MIDTSNLTNNFSEILKLAGVAAGSGITFAGFVYGCVKGINTVRKNARAAAKAEEDRVKEAYEKGVKEERERQERVKENEDERIARLKEIAEEWRVIVQQRDDRIGRQNDTIRDLTERVGQMEQRDREREEKYKSILEANAGLVAELQRLNDRFTLLELHHKGCDK